MKLNEEYTKIAGFELLLIFLVKSSILYSY